MEDLGLRVGHGSSEANSRQELDARLGQESPLVCPDRNGSQGSALQSRPSLPRDKTHRHPAEGKVRKSQFCTLIPGLNNFLSSLTCQKATVLSEQGNLVREVFSHSIHPQLTPASALRLSLLRERTTNKLSATTSSSRRRAPAPARPPASAFQEMATRSAGPRTSACPWRSSWIEGPGQHPLHLPRARTISTHRQPRSWQVGVGSTRRRVGGTGGA